MQLLCLFLNKHLSDDQGDTLNIGTYKDYGCGLPSESSALNMQTQA